MRTIGNGRIRRKSEGVSYGTGNSIKQLCDWDLASDDDIPTIEAAGYFNGLAGVINVGEMIYGRIDLNGTPRAKNWIVSSNDGSVVGIRAQEDDDAAPAGAARAVVATADGLTTGLLLATDKMVAVTSADANHIVTAPPIADVGIGEVIKGKNGGTAFEMRTPATSNTKINGTDADNTEAAVAAAATFWLTKVAADEWSLVTAVAGTVTAPAVD